MKQDKGLNGDLKPEHKTATNRTTRRTTKDKAKHQSKNPFIKDSFQEEPPDNVAQMHRQKLFNEINRK